MKVNYVILATILIIASLQFLGQSVTLTLARSTRSTDEEWEEYKWKFNKSYTPEEDEERRLIYEQNVLLIEENNAKYERGESSFRMGINKFTDMRPEEIRAGLIPESFTFFSDSNVKVFKPSGRKDLPDQVDYRKNGWVSPVVHQGDCSSCYAFGAIASIEAALANKTGKLVALSKQQLVDCSDAFGNLGCTGGDYDKSYKYLLTVKGIMSESDYPYTSGKTGRQGKCKFNNESSVVVNIDDFYMMPEGDEKAMKEAVATIGPVAASIDYSLPSFHSYTGGVYDPDGPYWYCHNDTDSLGHGVVAVGYGTDPETGKDYWLMKNSWGDWWGEKGYIRMVRNKENKCGVATLASVAVIH